MITGLKYTHPEAFEGNMTAIKDFDIRKDLEKIKVPVLLFRGSEDNIVTENCAKRMEQKIPLARLITVEGFGHHVLLQAPDKILEGISLKNDRTLGYETPSVSGRIRGHLGYFWYVMRQNPLTLVGLIMIVGLFVIGVFAPLLSPYDPIATI